MYSIKENQIVFMISNLMQNINVCLIESMLELCVVMRYDDS